MTAQCKYVLKEIKTLSENTVFELNYVHKSNTIYIVRTPNKRIELQKHSGELSSIIQQLIDDGYLDKTQFGFQLNHKGLHPHRVAWDSIKVFLLKSVLVPIGVSIVTSYLVNLLFK